MNFAIRVDGILDIGTGHVMRCLTLANALALQGGRVDFLSRALPEELAAQVRRAGHGLHLLAGKFEADQDAKDCLTYLEKRKPDWLIVDHYQIDAPWERKMRPFVGKLAVIDDLANRNHECDLILDQNFYPDPGARYSKLISASTETFFGPHYALLRPEFYRERHKLKPRSGMVSRLSVFFGGVDQTGETLKTLEALDMISRHDLLVDVVIGKMNPHRNKVEAFVKKISGVNLHVGADNMAELFAHADLALGAGGSTTWERCILGLPTFVVRVAQNQNDLTLALAKIGVVRDLGVSSSVSSANIAAELGWAFKNPDTLTEMSRKALLLMGDSPANDLPRVAKRLVS